jgi:hypothetical protein
MRIRRSRENLILRLPTFARRSITAIRNHRFFDSLWAVGPGNRKLILYRPFVPAGGHEATDFGQLSEKP